MSEMVERVAIAIWREREKQFPDRVKRQNPDEIDRATGAWVAVAAQARAAIEVMREPTPEILERGLMAGTNLTIGQPSARLQNARKRMADQWRAMIDEALK